MSGVVLAVVLGGMAVFELLLWVALLAAKGGGDDRG